MILRAGALHVGRAVALAVHEPPGRGRVSGPRLRQRLGFGWMLGKRCARDGARSAARDELTGARSAGRRRRAPPSGPRRRASGRSLRWVGRCAGARSGEGCSAGARVGERGEDVVAPRAADEEVVARVALDDEAGAPEHPGRCARWWGCSWPGCGACRARGRRKGMSRAERLRHEAQALAAVIEAVAERAGLEGAADDVVEVHLPDDRALGIVAAERGEAQRRILL